MTPKIKRLFDFAYHQLATNPQSNCFNSKINGNWIATSTKEYIEQANTISSALLRLGNELPRGRAIEVSSGKKHFRLMKT